MKIILISIVFFLSGIYLSIAQSQTPSDSIRISFVGNGEIQKAISSGGEIPANTGIGFIFDRYYPGTGKIKLFSHTNLYGHLNIVSTLDTLHAQMQNDTFINLSEFGNYVLLPTNAKHSATAYFKGYFYKNPKLYFNRSTIFGDIIDVIDGIQISISGSNRVIDFGTENVNASIFSIRTGIFHEFIPAQKRNLNDYSITIGADLSQRYILGDLGQSKNDKTRQKYLNTTRRLFIGGEYYLSFRFKNIIAEVSAVGLWPKKGEDFPGLTITRMVTTIKFVGGFPLLLK